MHVNLIILIYFGKIYIHLELMYTHHVLHLHLMDFYYFIVLIQGTKFPKMLWDSEEVNGTQQVNPRLEE